MTTKATYIYPSGDPKTAKLIIIGDQPSSREIMSRKIFSGPAGKELDENLRLAKIPKSQCYLTNVIKDLDHPLDYYFKSTRQGYAVQEEGRNYINDLIRELRECSANVMIALGNIPLLALADRAGISKWRGSILTPTLLNEKKMVPTFHPLSVLHGQYTNKHSIVFDLKRAWEIVNGDYIPTERSFITSPNFIDSIGYLNKCKEEGLRGTIINYDLEVDIHTQEVTCFSLAYNHNEAISIPFVDQNGDYFTIGQEAEIWRRMAQILEDPRIAIQGQNLCFDGHFLLRKYGIKSNNMHDTMIKQRILMPDYKIGLDFITSIWTDHPYYKEDGKFWLKGTGSWERGWTYNAIDSIICAEAGPKQDEALEVQGNLETYKRSRKIILPLTYMMEKGIKINVEGMRKAYDEKGIEISNLREELNKLSGRTLNANSPKQVKEYFYGRMGLKPYKKAGKVSTDVDAMKRISRQGFKEAAIILKIRGLVKERSTYLDVSKVDSDNRIRCSYNPVGTRYARISSRENIFGTGTNLQNIPHLVLRYYIADNGYIIYSIDLGQAENRIVAYEGRIQQMIDAFESGKDVHSLTGSLISGKTPDEVKQEDDDDIFCPLGSKDKTWRFWGKKANHGLNYDFGYKNFSLKYEIMEKDGKVIVNSYHDAYPGVRQGFHSHVKKCLNINRTLTNLMGRKTLFMGDLRNPRQRDALYKEAYSCIPQGTVGDVINERAMNFIYYNQDLFAPVEILMQVHDSITFQIPLSLPWKDHADILIAIKKSLETPLKTHYGREFVIPADLTLGLNMYKGDMKELKGNDFSESIETLSKRLETIYGEIS